MLDRQSNGSTLRAHACARLETISPTASRHGHSIAPGVQSRVKHEVSRQRYGPVACRSTPRRLLSTFDEEELQSANDELTTVNEQSLLRNHALNELTDELSNFISSADLPMVTVGRDLRIRRLTPAAQKIFNLLPTDAGRSLEHIKFSLMSTA